MSSRERCIVSIGSINADFQVRIERRPELSETLIGQNFLRASGGKAANVAFLATRLGMRALLIGRVGEDDLAEQALAPLRSAAVDLLGVTPAAGEATGVAMITVPPDGKKGIVLAANANQAWDDASVEEAMTVIRQTRPPSVLVADSEVPVNIVEAALEAAGRTGILRILDPSPADRVTDRMLRAADVAVPNPTEAETLTGITVDGEGAALKAGRELRRRGVGTALVKLPDGGCLVLGQAAAHAVKGPELEVVDTSGAGDAFAGALAVALAEEREMLEAARYAVAVSTYAVTAYGSQASYPERHEADRLLDQVITRSLR